MAAKDWEVPEYKFQRYSSSKHISGEASFRVLYYGGTAGSVPFLWESRPGTPKQPLYFDADLQPLTPPPSLRPSTPTANKNHHHRHRRSHSDYYCYPKFLNSILMKLPSKKIQAGKGCGDPGSGSPLKMRVKKMVESIKLIGN